MAVLNVITMWPGDPLAGLVVFGTAAPFICALFAALVGMTLAMLREKGAGSPPMHTGDVHYAG